MIKTIIFVNSILFQGVQKFVTHELDLGNVDFHVALVHSVATTCLKFPQAQNELFAQLFRFTNRQESDQKLSRSSPYLQVTFILSYCSKNTS